MVRYATIFVSLATLGLVLLPLSASADTRPSSSGKKSAPVTPKPTKPKVYTPSSSYGQRSLPKYFPWRRGITATIFWVGESPSPKNPTPNHASSWDTRWEASYGGLDDPNPARRTLNYRPAAFTPKMNPFYVALPYNDIDRSGTKVEARRVVPWFKQRYRADGRTVLKGQWLAIKYKNRMCFAQWEDCGPFVTDDWSYVFGRAQPKNKSNNSAGIDLSPAIRDYLKLKSGAKVDWKFVSASDVRNGPWKHYNTSSNRVASSRGGPTPPPPKRKLTIEELYEQRERATKGVR